MKIKSIDKLNDGYEIQTENQKYYSKKIISTINLSSLLKCCSNWLPKKITEYFQKLIINPMYVVSLGIKGFDNEKYTAIYFPEEDFLVNRISFPGTFSKYNCPKNCYSIQAEITYSKIQNQFA